MKVYYKIFEWNLQMKTIILSIIAVVFVITFVLLLIELSKNNNYYLRKNNENSYRRVNKAGAYNFVKHNIFTYFVRRKVSKNANYKFVKPFNNSYSVRRSVNRKQIKYKKDVIEHQVKPVVSNTTNEKHVIRRVVK